MSQISTENWMAILFFIVLCMWCIATFLFSRITVKHIEREMSKEGREPPVWDKGIGSVIVTYSLIIVFPRLNPIIVDFEAVRRYVRKKDKTLAWFYFIVTVITFVLMFIIAYLYGPEN